MSKAERLKLGRLKTALCFLASALKPEIPNLWSSKSVKIGKTTYLDGLRGVSAIVVYLTHHTMYAHQDPLLHRAFGWHGQYYFVTFPGIRLFWSGGTLAVGLFLMISGYVCSLSPLKLLHKGDLLKLSNNLGISLPRRFFRLYFPYFWITLLVVTAWHVFGVVSSNNATLPPRDNYLLELRAWLANFFRATYLWSPRVTEFDPINPHLWYIPAQFRGMLVLNAMTLCMASFYQWGTTARLCATVLTIVYFLIVVDGWYVAMTIMGMLAADIDLLIESEELPDIFYRLRTLPAFFYRLKEFLPGKWIWHVLFLVGLYLAGCPRGIDDVDSVAANDPGWFFINWLTPRTRDGFVQYWVFWASTFVLLAVPRIPWVRASFETPITLYFSKLSFGLYLVHGPIMWTLGARIYAAVGLVNSVAQKDIPTWWINVLTLPDWGPFGIEVNYIVAQAILATITLYTAGVVYKVLDEPSAQLANWLFDSKGPPFSKREVLLGVRDV